LILLLNLTDADDVKQIRNVTDVKQMAVGMRIRKAVHRGLLERPSGEAFWRGLLISSSEGRIRMRFLLFTYEEKKWNYGFFSHDI